jgi:hypothetical protein
MDSPTPALTCELERAKAEADAVPALGRSHEPMPAFVYRHVQEQAKYEDSDASRQFWLFKPQRGAGQQTQWKNDRGINPYHNHKSHKSGDLHAAIIPAVHVAFNGEDG